MRGKINFAWRMAIVLILVCAVAPAVVMSSGAGAVGPPETYMDPQLPYLRGPLDVISGTSLAVPPYDIQWIELQIVWTYPVADGGDGITRYWDAATSSWTATVTGFTADNLDAPGAGIWGDQQDWSATDPITNLPEAGDLMDGQTYTINAWAHDTNAVEDASPSTSSFISDQTDPLADPVLTTIGDASAPGWVATNVNSIAGTADDTDPGQVDTVQIRITRDPGATTFLGTEYWDGTTWVAGAGAGWIRADITSQSATTTNWQVTPSTYPPLPTDWKHSNPTTTWTYRVETRCYDTANRLSPETTQQDFTFENNWTGFSCHIDPIPPRSNTFPDITGNAMAGTGFTISDVQMRIRDGDTGQYWDSLGTVWTYTDIWFSVNPADGAFDALDENWDTNGIALPAGNDGSEYTVWAKALDSDGPPKETTPVQDTFIRDNTIPENSIIDSFSLVTYLGPTVFDTLAQITGTASDVTGGTQAGDLDSVDIQLWEDNNPNNDAFDGGAENCWNGRWWTQPAVNPYWLNGEWVGTAGATGNWRWQTCASPQACTVPTLPQLKHGMHYYLNVRAVDQANKKEATAWVSFYFIVDLSDYVPPAPPPPSYPTATPTYTAPVPTTLPTGTTVPTTPPAEPTYTTVPTTPPGTAEPTYTAVPTATTPPGFEGSGTVGASGGTVTAKDGDDDTVVTATFAANAFDSDTEVTIEGTGTCTGSPPSGYKFGDSCFDITPSQALGGEVEICVHYSAADKSAGGGDPDNLKLAYKSGGTWTVLDTTIDKTAGTACAKTTHLSYWAVVGEEVEEEEAEGWEWWHYLLIGLGALLIIAIIVLILIRPREEGEFEEGELGEEGEEETFEEEEL